MCVVSMIHDHYEPLIPNDWWPKRSTPGRLVYPDMPPPEHPSPPHAPKDDKALRDEVTRLSKLVEDFLRAKAAAEVVDELTNQPDCIDPKKAPLIDRVNDLQKRLDDVKREIGM